MWFGYFTAVSFTVCLCRHPTKKHLGPVSQQSKGKASARLESPIVITSDESGSDQLPVTPKMKGPLSGTIPKALENRRYLLNFLLVSVIANSLFFICRTPQGLPTTAVIEDIDLESGAILLKRPVPYVIYFLASVAFTVCPCRRPTKRLPVVPAVKREQASDIELGPVSQQSKGKARLRSPVIVSSDESGHDQLSDTPKAKGHSSASGIIPEALENQRCLLSIYLCLCCG
jgi:hypothetical protein